MYNTNRCVYVHPVAIVSTANRNDKEKARPSPLVRALHQILEIVEQVVLYKPFLRGWHHVREAPDADWLRLVTSEIRIHPQVRRIHRPRVAQEPLWRRLDPTTLITELRGFGPPSITREVRVGRVNDARVDIQTKDVGHQLVTEVLYPDVVPKSGSHFDIVGRLANRFRWQNF